MLFQEIKWPKYKKNEQHKKPLAQPQISVFGHSAEASTSIIKMKGDINFQSHVWGCGPIPNENLSKIFQGGNW